MDCLSLLRYNLNNHSGFKVAPGADRVYNNAAKCVFASKCGCVNGSSGVFIIRNLECRFDVFVTVWVVHVGFNVRLKSFVRPVVFADLRGNAAINCFWLTLICD